MKLFRGLDREEVVLGSMIGALLIVAAVALVLAVRADDEWQQRCEAAGGHVVTANGTGFDPKTGQPIATSTPLCLSPDGRILEV